MGRGAFPGRQPAARLRPERHQERRRDRPCPDLRERRVARAGRGGRHLVARRPRGFRQAHRGRVPGPARGRTAVDRDHRQRGGPAPEGPRARPAAARASAAARPAGAAVPVPDPLPALRGGVARAGGAARRRGGVRPRLRARPAPRADAGRADWSARHRWHAPVRLSRPAVLARRPGTPAAGGGGGGAGGPGLQQPARRPVPAEGNRADRQDQTRERGAAAGAPSPAAEQGGSGQGPRLHLLRRARHQPARRGVRGPDVVHRILRRGRPVRGRQGRRPVQGVVGGPGRARRRHLAG